MYQRCVLTSRQLNTTPAFNLVNHSNLSRACTQTKKLILKFSKVQEWHTGYTCLHYWAHSILYYFHRKERIDWNCRLVGLMIVSMVSRALYVQFFRVMRHAGGVILSGEFGNKITRKKDRKWLVVWKWGLHVSKIQWNRLKTITESFHFCGQTFALFKHWSLSVEVRVAGEGL